MDKSISEKLSKIPKETGVYKFFDKKNVILYVGKAINLKSRVSSYFSSDHLDRPWIAQMIPEIKNIETISTENEVESLILESNLIKKYRPKFNKSMKDDKSYSWIFIDTYSSFPRIIKTRDLTKKGKYFGPYPDGRPINRMLKYLRKIYPYANCKLKFYPKRDPHKITRKRVCIYYHLGMCPGICDNIVSPQAYRKNINNLIKTLEGKKKYHIKELEKKMHEYAANKNFEKAAKLRDKIQDLKYLSQKIDLGFGDTEKEFQSIKNLRYIQGIKEIAYKLELNIPEPELKRTRIECYDISNISGKVAYGSMSVSIGANIDNSKYRIFKISEDQPNDPEMLKNVLQRRLKYINQPVTSEIYDKYDRKESLLETPKMILLDGGRTQLSVVRKIIPEHIGIFAISKGKRLKRAGQSQEDEFWKVDDKGNIRRITIENPFLFQYLRDEAHRFAIKHHRKGRKFLQKKSILDEIEGIGPKRRKDLIKKFKSVEGIKVATKKEILKILKNEKVTENLIRKLNSQ
ncbi:excinuclease ABC subunit UvrC [Candidatus Dojkabacteria bacterium]|nr:excinuclease ABC subunit UvrC [Candidatus Dojkabacteria bacterium]